MFSRGGSLPPSASADARYVDAAVAFEGHHNPGDVRDCSNDCQKYGFTVPGGLPCLSVVGLQQAGIVGGVQWDDASSTPFLRWQDNEHNELWFDNPRSLTLKSEFARSVGAGGVSMWNAGAINYDNASQVAAGEKHKAQQQ